MIAIDRIPNLSQPELDSLYANAVRLGGAEGPHRSGAETLIPALEAELAARVAAAPPKPAPRKRVRKAAAAEA